jgi:putative SOS response-associated peptidase YedK
MCGRYVSPKQADLERLWHVRGTPDLFKQSFNVAPTMPVPIIYVDRHGDARKLALARWGLVPFWWTGAKPPTHAFNARLEDAAIKAMWRKPYRQARCIVPAAGWYEWQAREIVDDATGEVRRYKQPFFLHLPGDRPLGFAGLLAWTKSRDAEEWTSSCSILTTAATGPASAVHGRMPVALAESAHARWLDPHLTDPEEIAALIAAHQVSSEVVLRAVSTRVNASKADDALLLQPIEPPL